MAERTTVTELVQIGVESTSGTAVAASKQLPSLTIDGAIKTNIDSFRPLGNKFSTINAQGKEWVEAKVGGEPTYSEMHYMFSSLLNYAAPAQVGATTAYTWTHAPSSTSPDTVKTYTVERGSSVRASKFAYGIVSDLTLSGDRDNIDLSGMMLGQLLSDGITLTSSGSVTALEQIPMLPKEFSIYADTTAAGLGGTQLTRVLKWSYGVSGRFNPLWVVDASKTSWVTHVEGPPTAQVKLLVEADAAGMAFRANAQSGASTFIRILGTSGQNAGTATPYSVTIDSACQVSDIGEFGDEDGVQAIEFTFNIVHDSTWGQATEVVLVNKATAL